MFINFKLDVVQCLEFKPELGIIIVYIIYNKKNSKIKYLLVYFTYIKKSWFF